MPNVILLKGKPIQKERVAGDAVTPGDLLELNASGQVQRHSVSGGNAVPAFADVADFIGSGISFSYASGDTVKYFVASPGDEVYALLCSGGSVAIGTFLMSNADGTLVEYAYVASGDPESVVAVSLEDVDNTDGDADGPHDGATRIKVEVV